MRRIIINLATILIILGATFNVEAQQIDDVIICNQCSSEQDFRGLAEASPDGDVVITNLETLTIRYYTVTSTPFGQLGSKMVVDNPVPQSFDDALQDYEEIRLAFEEAISSYSSNSGNLAFGAFSTGASNGCGVEGDWTSLTPDFPFGAACDAHDQCFADGGGLSTCNEEFKINMYEISDSFAGSLSAGNALRFILYRFAAETAADGLYLAVSHGGQEFYCAIDSSRPECDLDFGPLGGYNGSTGGSYMYNTTQSVTSLSGSSISYTCELWRLPDGNGGYYQMLLNCG